MSQVNKLADILQELLMLFHIPVNRLKVIQIIC